jgi:hypothetical protein
MWTGQRLKQLPAPVVEKTKREYKDEHLYKGPTPAQRHFDALKRMLDRKEPDYATKADNIPLSSRRRPGPIRRGPSIRMRCSTTSHNHWRRWLWVP